MKSAETPLSEIYSFRAIGERLGTAGQPTEDQFRAIREAGFEVVVNLALPTSDDALADEEASLAALAWPHIPVNFQAPSAQDFATFCGMMATFENRRVFVHCAGNKRVSAFVFLYRVLHQRVVVSDAERDLYAIWQPDEVWSRFMQNQLARRSSDET